ncbi:MAG: family N-acetyltransferase [Candidatus Poribacteria bacterium]|nr:family N-acetyltransferase [Candidatus Poribacteria bacterium]
MSLSIENYDRKHLEGMTELYNAETAFEPYIAPLNPELFIELVEKKSYFDPTGLFIAIESGRIVGWVHACLASGSESWHNPENKVPHIKMLIYPNNRIKVGHTLVSEANTWLKKSGQSKFLAIHAEVGYPFYRGLWLGGEPMGASAMPHVQLAFESGGYKNTQESIFMTADMNQPPKEISADAKLEFVVSKANMAHKPMQESWIGFEPMRIKALIGNETAGSIGWVIIPYVAERLGAPCMNIWSLGVNESHRRKGIASALVSHTMIQSYKLGARFASVATQFWNIPAYMTYAKLGFIPYQLVIGRTLLLFICA